MNTFKKSLTVAMLLLFINVACSSSINVNISKAPVDSDSVDLSSEICGLVDDNVHLICFVESGYVRHKNVNCSGFLKGFAMITSITPLENQHGLK